MHAQGHEGESADPAGAERTDLRATLLPGSGEPGIRRQPTIDPPSSSAGGRAAGAGAEPVGFAPSRAAPMDVAPRSPSERRDPGANRNSMPADQSPRGC